MCCGKDMCTVREGKIYNLNSEKDVGISFCPSGWMLKQVHIFKAQHTLFPLNSWYFWTVTHLFWIIGHSRYFHVSQIHYSLSYLSTNCHLQGTSVQCSYLKLWFFSHVLFWKRKVCWKVVLLLIWYLTVTLKMKVQWRVPPTLIQGAHHGDGSCQLWEMSFCVLSCGDAFAFCS